MNITNILFSKYLIGSLNIFIIKNTNGNVIALIYDEQITLISLFFIYSFNCVFITKTLRPHIINGIQNANASFSIININNSC